MRNESCTQGCRKWGNREGASWEIIHARGKLISLLHIYIISKINLQISQVKSIIRQELHENYKTDCTNFLAQSRWSNTWPCNATVTPTYQWWSHTVAGHVQGCQLGIFEARF